MRSSRWGTAAPTGSHPPCRQAASQYAHDERRSAAPEFVVGMTRFVVMVTRLATNLRVGHRASPLARSRIDAEQLGAPRIDASYKLIGVTVSLPAHKNLQDACAILYSREVATGHP